MRFERIQTDTEVGLAKKNPKVVLGYLRI